MFVNDKILSNDFPLFWSIHDSNTFTIPRRDDLVRTIKFGVHHEIEYLRTTVKYLSWPYKSDCHHINSKSNSIISIFRF